MAKVTVPADIDSLEEIILVANDIAQVVNTLYAQVDNLVVIVKVMQEQLEALQNAASV